MVWKRRFFFHPTPPPLPPKKIQSQCLKIKDHSYLLYYHSYYYMYAPSTVIQNHALLKTTLYQWVNIKFFFSFASLFQALTTSQSWLNFGMVRTALITSFAIYSQCVLARRYRHYNTSICLLSDKVHAAVQ